LVLWNRGFTVAAFFDSEFSALRFQHALHSIASPVEDSNNLLFLSAYLRSPLARYYVFHTSASLGTERDQVHLAEAIRVPFFLPESETAQPDAGHIITEVANRIRRLKKEIEASAEKLRDKLHPTDFRLQYSTEKEERERWLKHQRKKSENLQAEIDPLIYKYFGLNEQEIALIEDTCEIFDKSDTPGSLDAAKSIPTLQRLDSADLELYANMLTKTLNGWASGVLRISALGDVDCDLGLGLVELNQTKTSKSFKTRTTSNELVVALKRLQETSTERSGGLAYLRGTWVFDGRRIYIVKPAFKGQWTRTDALNDAADLYAHIAKARRRPK